MKTAIRQSPSSSPSQSIRSQSPKRRQSKLSPASHITFSPSSHPSESGVKNITLKVIRRLEGFGHSEDNMSDDQDEREDEEEQEVVDHVLKSQANGGFIRSRKVSPVVPITTALNGDAKDTAKSKKIDWEIPRKVFHSSIGFVTIYLYVSQGSPKAVVYCLWGALCVIAPADYLRLNYPPFERVYEKCVGFLMRESEKHSTNGVIWYIIGVNFALTFYPLDVATVAILVLSWADTAASTVGRYFAGSSPRLPARSPVLRLPLAPRKSLAGFIAAAVTSAFITTGFWGWIAPVRSSPTWSWQDGVEGSGAASGWTGLALISVIAGLFGAIAEALDLGSLDDNLTLPIISGGCLLVAFRLIGFLFT